MFYEIENCQEIELRFGISWRRSHPRKVSLLLGGSAVDLMSATVRCRKIRSKVNDVVTAAAYAQISRTN